LCSGVRQSKVINLSASCCAIYTNLGVSFIIGAAGGAVNFWYLEDVSNGTVATFSKRSVDTRDNTRIPHHRKRQSNPEAQFPESTLEALISQFNTSFHLNITDVIYVNTPNPFAGSSSSSPTIKLVDGAEVGQALPLWSLIQPARKTSFIIAWDDNGDAIPYGWDNGTNLHNTYLYADRLGVPFPIVPSASTFIARNYTTRPVFFGCDANLTTTKDTHAPIVAYFAKAPYSAYSNISYTQANTSFAQVNELFENSFNQITQGNGTLDAEWPVCLGCAAIERSLAKVGLNRTAQCQRCFDRYCWDGTAEEEWGNVVVDPPLVLDPELSFAEWKKTNPFGN